MNDSIKAVLNAWVVFIAKVVTDAIAACQNMEFLNLEGNTLGVDAARAIGMALGSHTELRRALWKDMFTGRMKDEIPQALVCQNMHLYFVINCVWWVHPFIVQLFSLETVL